MGQRVGEDIPKDNKRNEDGVSLSTIKDFTRGDIQEAFSS
jgi:hypothetical protein